MKDNGRAQPPKPWKLKPRMVSIYELLTKLKPLMVGIKSAEDDLIDLWRMGAPDPAPNSQPCPTGYCELRKRNLHTCVPKFGCALEKRVLLPTQFAVWWGGIARRQGLDLTAVDAFAMVQNDQVARLSRKRPNNGHSRRQAR